MSTSAREVGVIRLKRPINRAVVYMDGVTQLVRIRRDGKNRYCLCYFWHLHYDTGWDTGTRTQRVVIAGGLTKLAARAMLKLMKEN